VDISNEGLGVGLLVGLLFWALGSTGEGSLIVEAVEIATSFLELLDPFLGLASRCKLEAALCIRIRKDNAYLCNHHMTVKGAPAMGFCGLIDMSPDGCNDRRAECYVGNKVTIPTMSA
jgi:hypothetical protein